MTIVAEHDRPRLNGPMGAPEWRATVAEVAPVPAWRRVLDDAFAFDRQGVRPRNGLRMAIGTAIALGVGYGAGSWAAGAAAAGGALAVGVTSVVPAARPRIAVLTSTAAAMALGTFIGSSTTNHALLHLVAVVVFTFACGLLVVVEPAAAPVGINAVVGLVVYGRFPGTPLVAAQSAGLVAAGGLFQVLLVVLVHGRPEVSRALDGLSRAYHELARYAGELDVEVSSLPAATAIDAAVRDREFSFASGASGDACTSLAGEARRIRLELLSLASVRSAMRESPQPDAAALASLDQLAHEVSGLLAEVVTGLAHADVPVRLGVALHAAQDSIDDARRSTADARVATAGAALAGQLRAVATLLPEAVDMTQPPNTAVAPAAVAHLRSAGRVSRRGARGARVIAERMRANLTWASDGFQHALRLAVVVTLAAAVAHAIGFGRGYWLALTAVLVLRPEFSVTFTRGLSRAIGTFVGVGLATAVALLTHPHGWVLVALVGAFVAVAGALFNASYAVFSVAVTGAVVFLLAGLDADPTQTARDRLLATVLGAAIALGLYAVWPAWGRRRVADAIAELADATRYYVGLVLGNLIAGTGDAPAITAAARRVRLVRTNAEAALERSLGDPASRRIDHSLTVDLLAGFRRQAIAAHTLRLAPRGALDAMPPALTTLVSALDDELAAIAARLRFGRVSVHRLPLRELHRAFNAALSDAPSDRTLLVLAETDELVDATNSVAELLEGHDAMAL